MSVRRTADTRSRLLSTRHVLLLTLLVLGLATGVLLYRQRPAYRVAVIKTPTGWGYDILNHGSPYIHQPGIPGLPGDAGFPTQVQARRVGERVVEKLNQSQALPTLTNDELRQLGVTIP